VSEKDGGTKERFEPVTNPFEKFQLVSKEDSMAKKDTADTV
jgi:hypothetical protein